MKYFKFERVMGLLVVAGLIISPSLEEAKAAYRETFGLPSTYSGNDVHEITPMHQHELIFTVYTGTSRSI